MLEEIRNKPLRRVVGLMSGTSVDGIDAALVEIGGSDQAPEVRLLAFEDRPWPEGVREQIFPLFRPETATVDKIGYMNFLMGEIYAQAVVSVVEKAGLTLADIDLIGSHGQTIWHAPEPCDKDGFPVVFTVQIGEGSVIAARTGVPTVSDFRVADLAVGGQGAPLVPFSEYLLYRRSGKTILLQNIGGIGNMTVLPGDEGPEAVYAFDTGPGNMIIDDAGGAMAAQGKVDQNLLAVLQQDPYYTMPLPKTTGRERFGLQYVGKILDYGREHSLSDADLLATVTDLTAWSITDAYGRYVLPRRQATELVVGGGGSFNATLLGFLRERFAPYGVKVLTQEDLGWSSDAKEAVAFAIMADRCVREKPNVLPSVTGARQAAIMGKISLPPV